MLPQGITLELGGVIGGIWRDGGTPMSECYDVDKSSKDISNT